MEPWFPTFRRWLATPWSVYTLAWPWYTTRTQSRAFVRLIAAATEGNVPLGPLVESWAADERGIQRYRMFRLARLLSTGTPLGEALEAVPNVVTEADLLAIRFDGRLGTRTAAMRESLQETPAVRAASWRRARNTMLYFGVVLAISLGFTVFTQVKIIPALSHILRVLEVQQPAVVAPMVRLTQTLLDLFVPVGLLALASLWLAFATRAGRNLRRALSSRLLVPWREWNSADLLRKLAIASRAGRPLAGVLSTLARYHFDPLMRHKLLYARNEVEQGADVWQSLTSVDLLAPGEVRLLETAERVGNRPWVLAQLADMRDTRVARRWERLSTWLLLVVVMLLGGIVFCQAANVFFPLFTLIQALT